MKIEKAEKAAKILEEITKFEYKKGKINEMLKKNDIQILLAQNDIFTSVELDVGLSVKILKKSIAKKNFRIWLHDKLPVTKYSIHRIKEI